MKVSEDSVAVNKAPEGNDNTNNEVNRTELAIYELTDQERPNRIIGQVTQFISTPAALFR